MRAKKLLEWGFHNFQSEVLFAEGPDDRRCQGSMAGERGTVPLTADRAVSLMVLAGGRRTSSWRGWSIRARCRRRCSKAQRIGTLRGVAQAMLWCSRVPLRAAESVGNRQIFRSAPLDAATELMIGLFRAGIQRL